MLSNNEKFCKIIFYRAKLSVDAILTDGSVVPVFRNGTWAFD